MANFTHYVFRTNYDDIVISFDFLYSDTLVGKLDIRFLKQCIYHRVIKPNPGEYNITIKKWFMSNDLILLETDENKKIICDKPYQVATLGSTNFLISKVQWNISYDKNYNLIVTDYLSMEDDVRYIGFITNDQFKWIRANLKTILEYYTCGRKITIKCSGGRLSNILTRIGVIFVTINENYDLLLKYADKLDEGADESIKNELASLVNCKAEIDNFSETKTNTLNEIKTNTLNEINNFSETKTIVLTSNKYCKLAFEYYLEQAKALFSVETVLLEIEQKAKDGYVAFEYNLVQRKLYKAFGENPYEPLRKELKSIIVAMYENFKSKMEKEGFNVSITKDNLVIETQITQCIVGDLMKKYVV